MKISPLASGGQPGQTLGSVDVGRTANPVKLERARAIARGEKVPEAAPSLDAAADSARTDVRRLKMRTNYSTNRDEPGVDQADVAPIAQETAAQPVSSTPEVSDGSTVEATQPLSPQFAALAKQKRAFQLEKAAFEKQKAESLQKQNGISSEDLLAKLKSNPLGVLQEHGALTPELYNSMADMLLNGQAEGFNPEIQALRKEIESLKKGVDDTFQSQEARQEEAALTEMLYEAESLAKEGETYELIRERNAYDQVLRLIHSTYKTTGRVLDVSEAMNRIENQLLSDAEKLAALNKVRNKLTPPEPLQQQPKPGMRTLTARDTATPALSRRARALAAFSGQAKGN